MVFRLVGNSSSVVEVDLEEKVGGVVQRVHADRAIGWDLLPVLMKTELSMNRTALSSTIATPLVLLAFLQRTNHYSQFPVGYR